MTEEKMALIDLIEKSADLDFVREMLGFAADRIMELEIEGRTGVAKGVRSPHREVQRNGSSFRLVGDAFTLQHDWKAYPCRNVGGCRGCYCITRTTGAGAGFQSMRLSSTDS